LTRVAATRHGRRRTVVQNSARPPLLDWQSTAPVTVPCCCRRRLRDSRESRCHKRRGPT
jgi:hypothetical protein